MINEQVQRIQNALFAKGYLVGKVDGVWGRRTIAALKAFQEDAHLEVDGIFGPRTARKLFPVNGDALAEPLLPWMAQAESLLGIRETPGPQSNPQVTHLADDVGIRYVDDNVAWCGLFVAHCIAATLTDEALPNNPLRARNWALFGESTLPRVGAVMVFWRDSPHSGLGHVGFYQGETETSYVILGGNQGNTVSEKPYPKSEFLEARWPNTARSLGGGRAIVPIDASREGASMPVAHVMQTGAPH